MVDDLEWMVAQLAPGGKAREGLVKGNPDRSLTAIVTGMGSLSYGELTGERMKLGLLLHDPEEEHDCFSDNPHYSHCYDAQGIRNISLGEYKRIDGGVKGPGFSALVAAAAPCVDKELLHGQLKATMAAMRELVAIPVRPFRAPIDQDCNSL